MKKNKKTIKNRTRGEPNNYAFWRLVVSNWDEVMEFINRGDARQKGNVRDTLEYISKKNPEYFKEIKGRIIMKKLKRTL